VNDRTPGKRIGTKLWVHVSAKDVLPQDKLKRAEKTAGDFPATVIKFDSSTGDITFINSPDFDTASEPRVGRQLLVRPDGSHRDMAPHEDPQIYHHKWLMVRDTYKGFDVGASKARSSVIDRVVKKADKSRIGNLSYWKEKIVPMLKESTSPPPLAPVILEQLDKKAQRLIRRASRVSMNIGNRLQSMTPDERQEALGAINLLTQAMVLAQSDMPEEGERLFALAKRVGRF